MLTPNMIRDQAAQTEDELAEEAGKLLVQACKRMVRESFATIALLIGFFMCLPIGIINPSILQNIVLRMSDKAEDVRRMMVEVEHMQARLKRHAQHKGWRIMRITPCEGGYRAEAAFTTRRTRTAADPAHRVIGHGVTREAAVEDALCSAMCDPVHPDLLY